MCLQTFLLMGWEESHHSVTYLLTFHGSSCCLYVWVSLVGIWHSHTVSLAQKLHILLIQGRILPVSTVAWFSQQNEARLSYVKYYPTPPPLLWGYIPFPAIAKGKEKIKTVKDFNILSGLYPELRLRVWKCCVVIYFIQYEVMYSDLCHLFSCSVLLQLHKWPIFEPHANILLVFII